MIKHLLQITLLILGLQNMSALAYETVQVGRYSITQPVALPQQRDILSVVIEIQFNSRIETVGDAINHVLSKSGYKLAPLKSSDPAMPILLKSSLPFVHRNIGPITIENALRALSGDAWDLIIDPVHRYVSFDLLEKYKQVNVVPNYDIKSVVKTVSIDKAIMISQNQELNSNVK